MEFGDAGFRLDVADDHAVWVRGEQQPKDSQPRLGAEGGEHVRVTGDVGVRDLHNYISTLIEI